MSSILLSSGVYRQGANASSIASSIEAAKIAAKKANVQLEDVDILMNVGIYRDKNMVEPAMAALIQKELGINPDYIKAGTGKNALSFDLMNGSIGALNAFQVADSFLRSGSSKLVLVVGADCHPSNLDQKDFPFSTYGTAVLLVPGKESGRGFQAFDFDAEYRADFGRLGKIASPKMGLEGRTKLELVTQPNFADSCLDLAIRKTKEFSSKHKIDMSKVKLVSSQITPDFGKRLGAALGISDVLEFKGLEKDPHSATFGLGIDLMNAKKGDHILFVGASSGLSFGCAHYVA